MSTVHDTPPPYDAICFDCDSTLSSIEGIDELAHGCADEIAALTHAAMSGEVSLELVYGKRLEVVRPSRSALAEVGAKYIATCLPNAKELVAALHFLDKRVFIVSGGVRAAVLALAKHLAIPAERTHAVEVFTQATGEYAGFDQQSPLARNGGKPEVLRSFNESSLALIGDGVSDLEAASETARFIAFGGVVSRPKVMESARVHCEIADFAGLLPLLCNADELARLANSPDHVALMRAASSLPS